MFARIRSLSRAPWGRPLLALSLVGLPLWASCTKSEDTEPFVPAFEGGRQPGGEGDRVGEDAACETLRDAALAAYKRLGCEAPTLDECPGFLRPGGGNGCYEYYQSSVDACVEAYEDAPSCPELAPCFATAVRNDDLPTCELPMGAAGAGSGGAGGGGAPTITGGAPVGGAPDIEPPGPGGAPAGGAAAGGASG